VGGVVVSKSKLIPLLVVVGVTFAAPPTYAATADFATGSGSTETQTFSFSAVGGPGLFDSPFSASGTMTYSGPDGSFTAVVICLVVDGNRAAIRGQDAVAGGNVLFIVEDNGTPGAGQDRFGRFLTTQDFGCGLFSGPVPSGLGSVITAGEIVVSGFCENPKEQKNKEKCKDKKDKS
jgi:hypothetical protein